MNMQEAIANLNFPKSLVRRSQQRDLVESFYASAADRESRDVTVQVYETANDKWFVVCTPSVLGWTRDPFIAFYILNNAFVYTHAEMAAMIPA